VPRRSVSYASHDPQSPRVSPAALAAIAIGIVSGPTGLLVAQVVNDFHPPSLLGLPMRYIAFMIVQLLAGIACWIAAACLRRTPHLWGMDLIKIGVGAVCAWPVSIAIFLLLSRMP
jgi:hypothetical protein